MKKKILAHSLELNYLDLINSHLLHNKNKILIADIKDVRFADKLLIQ